jgi:hypothetical protein
VIELVVLGILVLLAVWVFWTLSKLTIEMDGVLERLEKVEAVLASRQQGPPSP